MQMIKLVSYIHTSPEFVDNGIHHTFVRLRMSCWKRTSVFFFVPSMNIKKNKMIVQYWWNWIEVNPTEKKLDMRKSTSCICASFNSNAHHIEGEFFLSFFFCRQYKKWNVNDWVCVCVFVFFVFSSFKLSLLIFWYYFCFELKRVVVSS